ncbi:hypothetical protein [Arthrospiribacter ruber]|uniref:Uncharacterized protein n=1 Tax=Arthrospiribacter ruber TaxID=2487934 RepID=A0A951IXB6_9BACT|nr:hypothetical protein [Arthrospiribacter ruber]MBW3467777.1 hypothetical protein [Arthrospiribacter ruber]
MLRDRLSPPQAPVTIDRNVRHSDEGRVSHCLGDASTPQAPLSMTRNFVITLSEHSLNVKISA